MGKAFFLFLRDSLERRMRQGAKRQLAVAGPEVKPAGQSDSEAPARALRNPGPVTATKA